MHQKQEIKIKKFPIKINSKGEWFYQNSLIKKKALIKLFSSVLVSDNNGNFFLETPAEKGSIEVEDSPFVVISFDVKGNNRKQKIIFKTNLDDKIILSKENPLIFKKKRKTFVPYVIVRKNLEARILRSTYYQLIEISLKGKTDNAYSILSNGNYFKLK